MAALVEQGMREGAAGLSSGLEYDVGSYSATEELVALAKAAGKFGGFYMTHTRDEAEKTFEAFEEAIDDRQDRPACRSRSPTSSSRPWACGARRSARSTSSTPRAQQGLDATADCYPYEAWHSNLEVIVPDKQYDNPASVTEALRVLGGALADHGHVCKAHPEYAGQDARADREERGHVAGRALLADGREGGADIIGHSMKEEDVLALYKQPWVMVGSDGGIDNDHPRGAGTFPRVLGRFVREKHLFTLPEAIRKMTSLPAAAHEALRPRTDRPGPEGRPRPLRSEDGDRPLHLRRSRASSRSESSGSASTESSVWSDGDVDGPRPGRVLAGKDLTCRLP